MQPVGYFPFPAVSLDLFLALIGVLRYSTKVPFERVPRRGLQYQTIGRTNSGRIRRGFVDTLSDVRFRCPVVYEPEILSHALSMADEKHDLELIVDFGKTDDEAMKVLTDNDHYYIESSKNIPLDKATGEWTGIALVHNPKDLFSYLGESLQEGHHNEYDTFTFNRMVERGKKIKCLPVKKIC